MSNEGTSVMVQGRIVWVGGDLFKGKVKTVYGTQTPIVGVDGKPVMEYGFGLAIPKSILDKTGKGEPGEIWAALHNEAFELFPSRQIPPTFAMKFKDGDGIDDKGISFAQREGYAGCIVLACTTRLAIKFYKFENGNNYLVNEGIKCGDYVNVQVNVKSHAAIGQGKAGLYVNPNAVQLIGYGKEIINTPSGDAIFGLVAPVVPQGASLMPVAPTQGFITPQPAQQVAGPYYGVIPQNLQPQQFAQPPVPPMQQQFAQPPMSQAPMPQFAQPPMPPMQQQFAQPPMPPTFGR